MNTHVKATTRDAHQDEASPSGCQIVYETDEERKERLRFERLGDLIEERLNKVLDERDLTEKRPKKEKNIFDEFFS